MTTTPKNPRTVPGRARSKGKARATVRRTTAYPPEVREEAETLLREEGMAAARDATGVAKSTLSRWAKAAGIDLGDGARARTASATEAVRERAARAQVDTVKLLEDHIGEAGSYLSAIVTANALAAEAIAGLDDSAIVVTIDPETGIPQLDVTDVEVAKHRRRAALLGTLPLAVRDAEGIVTRAIHDLQLLRGEATERGELVVEFGGIPRPDPRGQAVDQHTAEDDAEVTP